MGETVAGKKEGKEKAETPILEVKDASLPTRGARWVKSWDRSEERGQQGQYLESVCGEPHGRPTRVGLGRCGAEEHAVVNAGFP